MIAYEIVEAKPQHCGRLARRLCSERWIAYREAGVDPHRQIRDLFLMSAIKRTALVQGAPVAMWGAIGTLASSSVHVWVSITREAAKHKRELFREAKRQLADMGKYRISLVTTIAENDGIAMRFAEALGFRHSGETVMQGGVRIQPMMWEV